MILQGAVFYSLPEAADAGEELCHLDAHLKILVGVYPEDQSWKDQSRKLTKVNKCSFYCYAVNFIRKALRFGV